MNIENLLKIKLITDEKVVKETLSRCGIVNHRKKIIYPTCYLCMVEGDYILAHFKQIFMLLRENAYNNMSIEDLERRNSIAFNLKHWGLIDVDDSLIEPHKTFISVVPHSEKKNYIIKHKINVKELNKPEIVQNNK